MPEILSPTSLVFKVRRGAPELVTPSEPTPYEVKPLSEIDNLEWFQMQVHSLMFYPHNPSMNGVDPAKLIKVALAKALVPYYPLAGRLKEGPTGKFTVECTGEGLLFVEADADVTLDQFDYPLIPPFSCLEELICEEPGSSDLLNCPLGYIQVTRLKCWGFIFGFRSNHIVCDAAGAVQFLSAVGQMARGASSPSVLPVWERHVFNSKNHQVMIPHVKYDPLEHDLCFRAFIFEPADVSALRGCLPLHLRKCSSFEIITVAIWKCRIAAIKLDPMEEMSLFWAVNLRGSRNLLIPAGYYGNAVMFLKSTPVAKDILENPLCYALQLLRNAKEKVIKDCDGSPPNVIVNSRSYIVSDLRHSGWKVVDFGWGKPIYAGPATFIPTVGWFYQMRYKEKKRDNGIMFPICLPSPAMKIFEMELNNMLKIGRSVVINDNATISKL